MDQDEYVVYEYLKRMCGEFVPAHQVCREADGRRRFESDAEWAVIVLIRLVEKGMLERDGDRGYRLAAATTPPKPNAPFRWISPQMKEILQRQGKLPPGR